MVLTATGKVGRHVVDGLSANSVPIKAVTRDEARARALFAAEGLDTADVEFVEADVSDLPTIRAAAQGCGQAYVATVDDADQVQIETGAVRTLLETGIYHIVKLSSCDAASDAPFSWARQHAAIEQQIADMTTEFSILRPHYFMQNVFSDLIDGVISLPAGKGLIGMIDARDIAAVAVKLLTDESPLRRTAELTGPEPVSFSRVAAAISAATNAPVVYEQLTKAQYLHRMAKGKNMSVEVVGIYQQVKDGMLDVYSDEVEKITGRQSCSIEQFAIDYATRFIN